MVELLIILFLILANGLFATAEFAIISARRPRLEYLAAGGNAGARTALELVASPTRFLSTVQVGITLIGILAGAFGGARVAAKLGQYLANLPWLGSYADAASFAIVVAGIAYVSVVLGELAPKRLALTHPEAIACALARPMRSLSTLAGPVVQLLNLSTEWLLAVFRVHRPTEPPVTEEELKTLIFTGKRSGVIHERESDLLLSVLRADDRRVREVATPRTRVVWIDQRMLVSEFLEFNSRQYYSHFPVGDGSLDRVVGVLSVKSVLRATGQGELHPTDPVGKLAEAAYFVPETKQVLDLLQEMRENGRSVALAIDEFGGISGLITFKQLVGEIVGQVRQEGEEPEFRGIGENMVQVEGAMRIDEANQKLNLGLPEGEYDTVAGFVMHRLGRIPAAGDQVDYDGLQLVVSQTQGLRIEQVTVTRRGDAAG